MGEQDPYSILGVERDATQEEIKAAYVAGAKECHPDVVGGEAAGERMRELNLAYELLSDDSLRARYDAENPIATASWTDGLESLVRVWSEEPSFGSLRGQKLAVLNREMARMEAEGWKVERKHDHLVCTKSERTGMFSKPRRRRVTINVDSAGRPFRVEQKRPGA